MAHIKTGNELPGIIGLFQYAPETGGPLSLLAEALLRAPSSLTEGEREMIAGHVSYLNECEFCSRSHAAFAKHYLKNESLVEEVRTRGPQAPATEKMKALLTIAGLVQKSGRQVKSEHIEAARKSGASDREIHDSVLIAAAFCMFNRYVDGLGTLAPREEAAYEQMAERICSAGYLAPRPRE